MTTDKTAPDWRRGVLDGEPDFEIDDDGIVHQVVERGAGVEFHDLMEQGTTLRSLQHRHLHLAYWETQYYRRALSRFLAEVDPADGTAVDLGCGDGRFTELLVELGFPRIIAVDADLRSLRSLAAHARDNGFHDRLLLVHAGAESFRLKPGVADVVLAIGVLYYLNERWEDGLTAALRVLAPGGSFIASEPDLEGAAIKALLYEGLDDFIATVRDRRFTEVHDGEKFRFRLFDAEELIRRYEAAGLDVLDRHGLSIFPSVLRIGMLRGMYEAPDIAKVEDGIRACFDHFDQSGSVHKHVIWKCRKRSTAEGVSP